MPVTTNFHQNYDEWGAEAIIVEGKWFGLEIIKKIRVSKEYRIKQIDESLRQNRTIAETRLLVASKKAGIKTPHVFEVDLENHIITMENIKGEKVKEVLSKEIFLDEKLNLVYTIGELVGKLHKNDIIHGDLTTSNILFFEDNLYFIDFGLGKFSKTIEDKAVDVLLMKKCFTSTHSEYSKEFFFAFQKGYKKIVSNSASILKRTIKAEARGRYLKESDINCDYLLS